MIRFPVAPFRVLRFLAHNRSWGHLIGSSRDHSAEAKDWPLAHKRGKWTRNWNEAKNKFTFLSIQIESCPLSNRVHAAHDLPPNRIPPISIVLASSLTHWLCSPLASKSEEDLLEPVNWKTSAILFFERSSFSTHFGLQIEFGNCLLVLLSSSLARWQ